MNAQEVEELQRAAAQMQLELTRQQAEKLSDYLDLLQKWNRAYNLTAIRERQAMRVQHVLDSLAIAPWIRPAARALDMGTGAGLPGVVLAIACPESHWTLVDAVGKKVRFLRQVRRELDLENIEPLQARLEALPETAKYEQITARALADLDLLTRLARPLLAPGGDLLAMKARQEVERNDIQCASHGFQLLGRHALEVPGLGAPRHVLHLKRCDEQGETR